MKISAEDTRFLEMLATRIPEKRRLVKFLESLLELEREAIYRRLRGQVPFSYTEAMRITKKLEISLDNLSWMGVDSQKVRPSRVILVDLLHPTDADYKLMDSYGETLSMLRTAPQSVVYCASNTLPQMFYVEYDHLFRFICFKLKYQQISSPKSLNFSEVYPPQRVRDIYNGYIYSHFCAKVTNLIMDPLIFVSIVNDIKYFHELGMIETDEVAKLKEDLLALVNELEARTLDGTFRTGCEFNVYISNINLDTSNVCVNINDEVRFCISKSFLLSDTFSTDSEIYEYMLVKMHSLLRTSTMISAGSAEVVRLDFLRKQRNLINQL